MRRSRNSKGMIYLHRTCIVYAFTHYPTIRWETLIARNILPASKIRGRETRSDPKDTIRGRKTPPRPKRHRSTRAKICPPRILCDGEKLFPTTKTHTTRAKHLLTPNTLRGSKLFATPKINAGETPPRRQNTREKLLSTPSRYAGETL